MLCIQEDNALLPLRDFWDNRLRDLRGVDDRAKITTFFYCLFKIANAVFFSVLRNGPLSSTPSTL